MAEYYLKNTTGSEIAVDQNGYVISDGQSITIDENDFDGVLTDDLIAALDDDPNLGLILSTTDIGDASGDLPKQIAIERLLMKSQWKPSRETFGDLPSSGNEDGDIRLVEDEGTMYRWVQNIASWEKATSTFSLTVTEYDDDPLGTEIEKLVFVQPEDAVYVDYGTGIRTAYIGPPDAPESLNGKPLLLSGSSFYTGGLSQSNINYKSGDDAGDVVSYITNDATMTLTTSNSSDSNNYGDRGTITAWLNGTALCTIDLGANFNEANRDGNQNLLDYNTAGSGDIIIGGTCVFTGAAAGYGSLELLSVGRYNGFKFFQKWTARINITDSSLLRQGYNYIYLTHDGLSVAEGGNQQSATTDVFYDTDTGANPSVTVPTITEDSPVFRWLSGVKFYDTGSTWQVDVTGIDCFDNVYHSSGAPIELYGWPGMPNSTIAYNHVSVSGVSDPPDIDETMTVNNWPLGQVANQFSTNARITARARDPYGTYTPQQSVSQSILIWSYGNSSTDLVEHFRDEQYRLLDDDYNTIPASITGQWDSTQSLVTYDGSNGLQVYADELYFPTVDFSTYMPTGNPDYTGLAGDSDKVYLRAFRETSASRASGTLRLTGITKTQLYNRDVRVWIKAPSQTGWLDLTRDYNFSSFTGIDEDGCWVNRSGQSNSDFQFTLGSNYTVSSGYMIIVKIQYPDSSAPRISYMAITDW